MVYSYKYSEDYSPSAPIVEFRVWGPNKEANAVTLIGFVDSGADASIIPLPILYRIGANYLETMFMRGVHGFGQEVDIYIATITIGHHVLPGIQVASADPGNDIIIGRNVLNQLIVTLNGLASVMEIWE